MSSAAIKVGPKECPKCGISNRATAVICDCGYDFAYATHAAARLETKTKPLTAWMLQGALVLKVTLTVWTFVALTTVPGSVGMLGGWVARLPASEANLPSLFGRALLPFIGGIWGVIAIGTREKNQFMIALCLAVMSIASPFGLQDSPVFALGLMATALLSRRFKQYMSA